MRAAAIGRVQGPDTGAGDVVVVELPGLSCTASRNLLGLRHNGREQFVETESTGRASAVIGSHLLGQQPTFGGADFGMPEIALFGYYQFRSAVPTSDTWEQHEGVEFLFMQSGEACWDLPDDDFWSSPAARR